MSLNEWLGKTEEKEYIIPDITHLLTSKEEKNKCDNCDNYRLGVDDGIEANSNYTQVALFKMLGKKESAKSMFYKLQKIIEKLTPKDVYDFEKMK